MKSPLSKAFTKATVCDDIEQLELNRDSVFHSCTGSQTI